VWPLDNSQEQKLRMVCVKYVNCIDHSISVMAKEFEVFCTQHKEAQNNSLHASFFGQSREITIQTNINLNKRVITVPGCIPMQWLEMLIDGFGPTVLKCK